MTYATRKAGLLAATVFGGILMFGASQAHANIISIGLQEVGFNGGAIDTVATDGSGSADANHVAFGTFLLNNVQGTGAPFVADPNFGTSSLDASGSTAGTLHVYITDQGVPGPIGSLASFFTSNTLTNGWTVTEATYIDSANGVFTTSGATVTLLDSESFSAIGSTQSSKTVSLPAGTYSETVEYTINANGVGSANSTVDIAPVPEPATYATFGVGLLALASMGFVAARRRS